MSSPSPKTHLEHNDEIKTVPKSPTKNVLEANVVMENRKLNDTIVSLSNKQNDLLAIQNQLKLEIETKDQTIADLTNQMNNFVNNDNYAGDEVGSLKNFDDNDTQSVKSTFSIGSMLNSDGTSGVNVDSKKMLSIVVNQRDLLKQKLKNAENQIVEKNKLLEVADMDINKLKDKLNYYTRTQTRHGSTASSASYDMESQLFKRSDSSLDFSDNARRDSFSRRYSNAENNSYLNNIHRYVTNLLLKDPYKRGMAINYFILLHLIILLVLILHPLRQQTDYSNKITTGDVPGKSLSKNLPPTGGNVMHAPGKGNAQQAAKNNII